MPTFKPDRRAFALAALAALGSATLPRRAGAQWAVTCVNCSDQITQLMQYAKEVEGVMAQARAYSLQMQQYANMIQNTVALPRAVWANVESDIMRVRGLLGMGSHYTLSSGFNISQLGSYSSYVAGLTNMPMKYEAWSRQANSSIAAILRGLGLQQEQMADDQAVLAAIRANSDTAQGQMQAIQAGNQMAGQAVVELQKLRQIYLAEAQARMNAQAIQADQQAYEAARLQRFLDVPDEPVAGWKRY